MECDIDVYVGISRSLGTDIFLGQCLPSPPRPPEAPVKLCLVLAYFWAPTRI